MQQEQGPHQFGSYEILEELGRGYSGVVYRARHTGTDEIVALKILTEPPGIPNAARKERFQREARSLSAVSHPAIPRVLESGNLDGYLFIVREYFPGRTLRAVLDEQKTLPEAEAVRIIGELLAALSALHAKGIIHRDLKPENVIIQDDGAVRILDLGAAHDEMEDALTRTGEMIGTPAYMSPEQIRGTTVDGRSDLFAAAILLHELLTGVRPFVAKRALDMLRAIEQNEPRIAARIPALLRPVLSVALAKRPEDRFASAAQMRMALEGAWPRSIGRPGTEKRSGDGWRVTASALRVLFPVALLAALFAFAFVTLKRFSDAVGKWEKTAAPTPARAKAAPAGKGVAKAKGGSNASPAPARLRRTVSNGKPSAGDSRPAAAYSRAAYAPAPVSHPARNNYRAPVSQPRNIPVVPSAPAAISCASCNGSGHLPDHNCGGTGKCHECGGSGQKSEKCFDCDGAGTARCYMCEGSGTRKLLNKSCETCGGSGKAKCITCGGHGHRKCLVCAGTGKCPPCNGRGQQKCDTCSGRGTVRP